MEHGKNLVEKARAALLAPKPDYASALTLLEKAWKLGNGESKAEHRGVS
jgi:hypothetical protein